MTGWKQNIHFSGVFSWGSVLLWFRSPVVYEQSWTATAFPVPLWVLALEPSLGDSTQLILQCQLTDSLCNSWASLLWNAGFLMQLWVTPNTILNFHVQLNKELELQAELLATTPSNLRLFFQFSTGKVRKRAAASPPNDKLSCLFTNIKFFKLKHRNKLETA